MELITAMSPVSRCRLIIRNRPASGEASGALYYGNCLGCLNPGSGVIASGLVPLHSRRTHPGGAISHSNPIGLGRPRTLRPTVLSYSIMRWHSVYPGFELAQPLSVYARTPPASVESAPPTPAPCLRPGGVSRPAAPGGLSIRSRVSELSTIQLQSPEKT
ncbi:hypothetical protein VTK56DRAFT_8470 [Thermocarpiscus australiensis]